MTCLIAGAPPVIVTVALAVSYSQVTEMKKQVAENLKLGLLTCISPFGAVPVVAIAAHGNAVPPVLGDEDVTSVQFDDVQPPKVRLDTSETPFGCKAPTIVDVEQVMVLIDTPFLSVTVRIAFVPGTRSSSYGVLGSIFLP